MNLPVQQQPVPSQQLSSLFSPSADTSTDSGSDLSTGDSSSGGAKATDTKAILQTIEQILQALLSQAESQDGGDQDVGGGQAPGSKNAAGGQGQGGVDPDIAALLAQIAREFEARMANQNNPDSGEDDGAGGPSGVGGAGGGGGSSAAAPASGGQAPSPTAGAQPAATTQPAAQPAPAAQAQAAPQGDQPAQAAAAPAGDSSGANGLPPGVRLNAGGVPQADAIEGVSPHANPEQVKETGTGTDKTFNVTNATKQTESFTYSVGGDNKATITLKPGETGAFKASAADVSARITPDSKGVHGNPNEVLFEDGSGGNPDISKVDGDKDAEGRKMNMTVTMSDGGMAGDGDAIHAYAYSTDDAASMGLAGNKSNTASIVMSDAA